MGAKLVQIEQNTKEITFFLCIFEMQPIFETSLKDTTNLSRIQIFEIISYYGLISYIKVSSYYMGQRQHEG